ncbi:unnamed protein product [Camellia sinensis]
MPKQGGNRKRNESFLTRSVNSVFAFVRFAEFEILFVLFFLVAFIIFKDLGEDSLRKNLVLAKVGVRKMEKDEFEELAALKYQLFPLTARPEYNQILVKKPGGPDWWSD